MSVDNRKPTAGSAHAAALDPLREQLSAWLAATDIELLELSGPDGTLRLCQRAGRVVDLPAQAPAAAEQIAVTAPSAGRFLRRHPLHDVPLAREGDRVQPGQPLGLLQVGSLLRPVLAPVAGIVTGFTAADDQLAGWGTPLAQLQPLA